VGPANLRHTAQHWAPGAKQHPIGNGPDEEMPHGRVALPA